MKDTKYYIEWALSTWFGLKYVMVKYDSVWDRQLGKLIKFYSKTAKFSRDKRTIIFVSDVEVWVCNRFYSYGSEYKITTKDYGRPSVKTMIELAKLQDILMQEWIDNG